MAPRRYQVKDVSRIAGISIRALHHYDAIGLLVPTARSEAGYRLYTDDDLLRLQQIIIGRELGLPLEAIRRSLDDPRFDRQQALRAQRQQLRARAAQTEAMIAAVDAALALLDGGAPGGSMDMKDIFDGFDASKYEHEAQERWGDTSAYHEAAQRTKRYTAGDWTNYRAEQAAIYADMAAVMRAGKEPHDRDAVGIAERHRLSIDRWFYPCSSATHRGLAEMYISDGRFSEAIDKHCDGLTAFLAAAIRANADRAEG
jgi:DNA-binding transcriptional MerR regulator